MYLFVSLLSVFMLTDAQPSSQRAALRIVVIEGEDAINVIQQKTAVAPVIEVRDRNNLPVAGATVTFSVGGNSATFAGGAQTFTVATNAAGRAAVAAVNPLSSGAVQIQVSAAFQGQTALATIAQTNVLTAAEAAGATSAAASGASGTAGGSGTAGATGGAAGGGGGVSGTTIGIVGAAVAGGAVAATQAGGSGEESATTTQNPQTFRGSFASTLHLTFQGCTRDEAVRGDLEITLRTAEPLAGEARVVNATTTVVAVTCGGGPQVGSAPGSINRLPTAVTGTASNFGFTGEVTNTYPPSGVDQFGGTNTTGYSFTGALNGPEITGTLTHSRRITSDGSSSVGVGSVSMVMTLR